MGSIAVRRGPSDGPLRKAELLSPAESPVESLVDAAERPGLAVLAAAEFGLFAAASSGELRDSIVAAWLRNPCRALALSPPAPSLFCEKSAEGAVSGRPE